MSANPEFFEHVGSAARRYTVKRVRETGAPLDRVELDAFLAATAEAYVADGNGDVDEDMVADVLPRVARYCLRMDVRPGKRTASNERLFRALDAQVKAWTVAHRRETRAPVDTAALQAAVEALVAAYRAVPGQAHEDDGHAELVDRWTAFYGRMTAVRQEGTRKAGATVRARRAADLEVYLVLAWEREFADREGRAPRRMSIDEVTYTLRDTGMKRSAIRGALQRLRGRPERQAIVDGLSGTARDLVEAIETSGIPQNRITVVRTDALAEKLWPATTVPATKRKHRQRLRAAASEICAAPIDLHLAVGGEVTVIGRGRRLPDGPEDFAAEVVRKGKVRAIPGGLLARRQGDWGTPEGQDAQALCRVLASHAGDEDMARVLIQSGLPEAVHDFLGASASYADLCHRDTSGWCTVVEERTSGPLAGIVAQASGQAAEGVERIRGLVDRARRDGLGAAWGDYVAEGTAYAYRLHRAEAAPVRERLRRIGAALALAPAPEAWEEAMLLSVSSGRPGRRPRALAMPPERRHPGRAAAAHQPEKKPVSTPKPAAPRFVPQHHERTEAPAWLADEMQRHWSINRVQPEVRSLRFAYACYTPEQAAAHVGPYPYPGDAVTARTGLRTILKSWGGIIAEVDALVDHAIHGAVVAAGIALRDHGDDALAYAHDTMSIVYGGLGSLDRYPDMQAALVNLRDEWRWLLAQRDASGEAAAA